MHQGQEVNMQWWVFTELHSGKVNIHHFYGN